MTCCSAFPLRLNTRDFALCTQEVSGSAEEEYRPPSPKYDERNFFMSTQNPWVAARPAASPGKRSPAVPRSAAFATPPMFALTEGSGAPKRLRIGDETGGRLAQHAEPKQQGQNPAEPMPGGDAKIAVKVEDPWRKAPQGLQAAPVPPANRPIMKEPAQSTLPGQMRARLESQVRSVGRSTAPVRLCLPAACVMATERLDCVATILRRNLPRALLQFCAQMLISGCLRCSVDIAGDSSSRVRRCDAPQPGGLQAHRRRQGPAADPRRGGGPCRQQV